MSELEVAWKGAERIIWRGWRLDPQTVRAPVLVVQPAVERPTPVDLNRLAHEYDLREVLDSPWAARPVELVRQSDQSLLVLEDPGGTPLEQVIETPLATGAFLRLAVGASAALAKVHERRLVHKDVKPANILVNCLDGLTRMTGFGIASRFPREATAFNAPETITGSLAYMAPEQTGRMNRSIDSRSDLYALGVTFYRMITGCLPFSAADLTEWIHCHVARTPITPSERRIEVPPPVSQIIMRLLSKMAEDRYQTASGLKYDLERCLKEWERTGRIEPFPLGERDIPDQLLTPEKLYGRERQVEALLAVLDRSVESGATQIVLVSGYSGIGKSSVVNELRRTLVPPRGLFASGKSEQHKQEAPYSTLSQALQSLVQMVLTKSDAELVIWQEALREALGPNGRLIADLVPRLTLVLGEQPPVAELESQQAKARFRHVLRRFISVFARPKQPLALFLDDLQWLDPATLDFIEDVATEPDIAHLVIVGAYRDNELGAGHPLEHALAAIRSRATQLREIKLEPLEQRHVAQLITDALRVRPEEAASLAQLAHAKTAGNPFFVAQFLRALAEEGQLSFDHQSSSWRWEVDRIDAKGYTDNVAVLMVDKLARLPARTQAAVRELAYLGASADLTKLAIVLGVPREDVPAHFWGAVRAELVGRLPDGYRFAHDRIREAAYSLVPEDDRAAAHLRIGRLLAAHIPSELREEAIFDIVNQLNAGARLLVSQDERDQLAEFNLMAGRRARASAAHASALNYLVAGVQLLAKDASQRRHELFFRLELDRAECEFLLGELAESEKRLEDLANGAANAVERAAVTCLRVDLYSTLGQFDRAIETGLEYLRGIGKTWSPHPTANEARAAFDHVRNLLDQSTMDDLPASPLMSDPASLATLNVLTKLAPTASWTDENLEALIVSEAAALSLEHGLSDGSCLALGYLGFVSVRFGDFAGGLRLAELGCELVNRRGLDGFAARTFFSHAFVLGWTRTFRSACAAMQNTIDIAEKAAELFYVGYAPMYLTALMLLSGEPLGDVQGRLEICLSFVRKMGFRHAVDVAEAQLVLVKSRRFVTRSAGAFDDGQPQKDTSVGSFTTPRTECWYWIRQLQGRYFAGDYLGADEAAEKAKLLVWASTTAFEIIDYRFYSALSRAASCSFASADEPKSEIAVVREHYRPLQIWAEKRPENFHSRASLIAAEISRIEGRVVDAERLYEEAIRSAEASGFVNIEALANELAARFYAERGFEKISRTYLQDARYGYVRWGADGKVRQLDTLHPHVRKEERHPGPSSTIGAPLEQLDLSTVIKVSQAISGEILLEKLIDTLMRTAIEQAGAERGLLLISETSGWSVAAEAVTRGDKIAVRPVADRIPRGVLPETVFQYVQRTHETIILNDAAVQSEFSADPYILDRRARSILFLPLTKQGKLVGVLYLENNLASGVFAPARIAMLKLLASQAAIALENSHLYRELAEREAKIRRLIDSNIVGIFTWRTDGLIIEANDAFLAIVGYEPEDVARGRLSWREMSPGEGRSYDERQAKPALQATSQFQPYEREVLRKDGSRAPVLIGGTLTDESGKEGIAFVLDIRESKRAAEALHEAQMQLQHANRLETMGQMTASIAHEVNQPITATVTNALAALRWLERPEPDLEEVNQALRRIVRDGTRAGSVVQRIRALTKKTSVRQDPVNMNAAIREVVEISQSEAAKTFVAIETEFDEGLPLVQGDRVQLQQVVLNLVLNAIDAMSVTIDGPRTLTISTGRDENGELLVAVCDTGMGLTPEIQQKLFQSFVTTKTNGLGLGLSISRSILDAHGGRLWAEPNTPRGTVFRFTLPSDSAAVREFPCSEADEKPREPKVSVG